MKYILISSDKDRYDRSIEISIDGIFDDLKTASDYLMKWIPKEENIINAIKNKENSCLDRNEEWLHFDYTDNYLTYYSTSCPATNEYCGETHQIFEIKF